MNPDQQNQDPALRRLLRTQADSYRAPEELRAAIRQAMQGSSSGVPAGASRPAKPHPVTRWVGHLARLRALLWPLATVGSFLLGCWLGPAAYLGEVRPEAGPLLVALVGEHGTALRGDGLVSVRSSDSHTVKPWLSRHLGYSPVVSDLRNLGFALSGARLAHIAGEDVAVLAYQFREHEIDVYVLRGSLADQAAALRSGLDGYHLRSWMLGSLRYVAVSDVQPQRLEELAQKLQAAAPTEVD